MKYFFLFVLGVQSLICSSQEMPLFKITNYNILVLLVSIIICLNTSCNHDSSDENIIIIPPVTPCLMRETIKDTNRPILAYPNGILNLGLGVL